MPPFFTSLPEEFWPEINRRLHNIPALWELSRRPEVAAAFLELGQDLEIWRPGQLGLAALSRLEPGAAPDPAQWLRNAGREKLAQAYNSLVSQDGTAVPPAMASADEFIQATLAGVALQQRISATRDLRSIAAEASANLGKWTLALVCLYSLLDEPSTLIAALMKQLDLKGTTCCKELVDTVIQILIANETPDAISEVLAIYLENQPNAVRLLFAHFLSGQALHNPAKAAVPGPQLIVPKLPGAGLDSEIASIELPGLIRALGDSVENALLAEYSGESAAHSIFGRLVEAAQSLSAELALHLGHLALSQGDAVSALAALQEAQSLRPYDQQLYGLLAEASAIRGDEHGAHVALNNAGRSKLAPATRIATARAQRHLGNAGQAKALISPLLQTVSSGSLNQEQLNSAQVTATAELLSALDEHPMALAAWQQLTRLQPANAAAYRSAAQHALALGLPLKSLDHSWEAVGLKPDDPSNRKMLAAALAANKDLLGALEQWKRVVELNASPQNRLAMAAAALAAGEYSLALATATALISDPSTQEMSATGQAQILAGRALSAQGETDAAFIYFNKAIALAPNSIESWRAVAAHHRLAGDPQRALAALDAGRHLIDSDSSDAAEFFADLGELRADLHHLTEATNAYEKAVDLRPQQLHLLKRLGELYRLQNKLPRAVDAIGRAAQAAPNDPTIFHLLGQLLEAAGRFPDALAAYRRAQTVGSEDVQLYRDLGRLAYQLQETTIARPTLEKLLVGRDTFEQSDLGSLVLLGAIYERSSEFAAALEVYKHAIALDSSRSDLCVRLGLCCLELGQPETALAALKDAAERDLDNLELQKVMGNAYEAAHLWQESILAYEQASRLAPDDHHLLEAVARAARKAGDPGRAVAALRKAIALAPDSFEYRAGLGELLIAVNQVEDAKALYAESCCLTPDQAELWMGLGQTQIILDDISGAARSFEKAATLKPDVADFQSAMGEANVRLGSFESAHAAFARAAELDSANPVPLRRAGECMWSLGREAMAMALWRKGLVAHPDDTQARWRLGMALVQQRDYKEAVAELTHASDLAPHDWPIALAAGQAALANDDPDTGISYLQRAVQVRSDESEIWQALSRAWQKKGKLEEALASIRKAIRLAPEGGLAHATLARLLALSGNLPEALTASDAALKASPDDLQVLEVTGEVLLAAGNYSAAADATGKVAAGSPNNAQAHFIYAQAQILLLGIDVWDVGAVDAIRHKLGVFRPRILQALERAAALGYDSLQIADWTGRARALFGEPAEAISLLETAAAQNPSAECLRVLSACYRQTGNLPLARQASLASVERRPDNVPAVVELGLVCAAQGDKTAARAAFQRAIGLDIHYAPAYFLLAETMIGAGERGDAITVYNQALSLDSDKAGWHYRLAELYEAERDTAAALAHYQRAATLATEQNLAPRESAGYLAALARAHARDNDLEQAKREYEAALALRDDVSTWWSQCGRLNFELKNYQRALDQFCRACQLQPKDTASFMGAARAALALGQAADAEENAISVLRHNPDNYDALIVMAEVFEGRGDLENALLAYTRASENTAQPLSALRAESRLLRAMRRPLEAQAILKRITELTPDDDEAWAALAELQAEVGTPVQAIPLLARAVQIAPRKALHYVALGRFYRLADQLDAALGQLQLAWEVDPNNVPALREMAQVFEGRRQFSRAYEIYQQLMQLEPENADNFFRAGLALKEMRDYLDALALFQQAVKLDPQNAEAQHQRAAVAAFGILKGKG
jgi:tetratricopeptide (TPR) repeat protein